ncbi:NAD(P) transhydrogenase subunit beta [Lysobacter capsici]|nr:NAD(P) transhydrogenase subunit beta [Lysobacter capsici]
MNENARAFAAIAAAVVGLALVAGLSFLGYVLPSGQLSFYGARVLMDLLPILVKSSYLVAATLFLLGLQRMASPVTARSGIRWAGAGMVIATVATFALPGVHNFGLIALALLIGTVLAWVSGKKVAITDMPQMVALYNGMGGGSAAAIGAVELLRLSARMPADPLQAQIERGVIAMQTPSVSLVLAVIGAAIGAISLSGSVIAWAKLDGRLDRRVVFPGQQVFNAIVALAMVALGIAAFMTLNVPIIIAFFVVALALGVLMTLPIGGADMPVVISLYNAFTGLAVAFEGYVLGNEALIIAGTMVGAAGMLLTRLMAKAMNRPISGVLFSNFGGGGEAQEISGTQKPIEAGDVAAMMAFAERVVIVPGYGLAVAQAQHKIWELTQKLMERGVKVKFAIHPVAGRMPGHMNVLLAEAGVPYDLIVDMDDINPEFANTDVSLVIGANDVVNPVAKTDPASPIYGMPILDVINSKNTIVIKRGKGTGFAGIENALFYADNTRMLYGDGAEMASALVSELKGLDGGH